MIGVLVQVLQYAMIGMCLTSISMVLFSLAALLRLLPRLMSFTRLCLRGLLILSFRLYDLTLSNLAPLFQRFGIDLLSGYPRLIACMLLSLLFGLLIITLIGLPINGWTVAVSLIHGLLVGLAWDETGDPDGLQLGKKIR
jgi:hypothetical protein